MQAKSTSKSADHAAFLGAHALSFRLARTFLALHQKLTTEVGHPDIERVLRHFNRSKPDSEVDGDVKWSGPLISAVPDEANELVNNTPFIPLWAAAVCGVKTLLRTLELESDFRFLSVVFNKLLLSDTENASQDFVVINSRDFNIGYPHAKTSLSYWFAHKNSIVDGKGCFGIRITDNPNVAKSDVFANVVSKKEGKNWQISQIQGNNVADGTDVAFVTQWLSENDSKKPSLAEYCKTLEKIFPEDVSFGPFDYFYCPVT